MKKNKFGIDDLPLIAFQVKNFQDFMGQGEEMKEYTPSSIGKESEWELLTDAPEQEWREGETITVFDMNRLPGMNCCNSEGEYAERILNIVKDTFNVPKEEVLHPIHRQKIKELYETAAYYCWNTYGLGMPKNIKDHISTLDQMDSKITKFLLRANRYSQSETMGGIVCLLTKVARAYHEVRSKVELRTLKKVTQDFGAVLCEGVPSLEGQDFSADLLEKKTGTYIEEGDTDIVEKKKKLTLDIGKGTASKNAQSEFLQIVYEGEDEIEKNFQALAIYFSTKTEDRMVGKVLRKPNLNAEKIFNDGARGRIMVREKDMANAEEWLISKGMQTKDDRMTDVSRSEIIMFGQMLNSELYPLYRDVKSEKKLELPGAIPVEFQIISNDGFEKGESGAQNHEVFQWAIQVPKELCRKGSISNATAKKLLKKAYDEALKKNPEKPVSQEKIFERFESNFFQDPTTKRWHSFEFEMRVGFSPLYPDKERKDRIIKGLLREVTDYWPRLDFLSIQDLRYLFETYSFPVSANSLKKKRFLCELLNQYIWTKPFEKSLKNQLDVARTIEEK